MINLSELRIVEDTFLKSRLLYEKASVHSLIDKHFNEQNDYSEATLVKLKNLVKGHHDMAYNKILQEDVNTLLAEIETTPKQFDEKLWRDMLPRLQEEVKKTLGLSFKTRPVYFNDKFPQGLLSFELKGASSLTVFEGQKDAGIYFINKRVSSFFTPINLIHEQLHSCLSQNKSKEQMYIEWFEEGLCQWYSLKIYYQLTKNLDIVKLYRERSYLYSKVKDEHNFTKRYYEYMKLISAIYLNGGEKLIGEILVDYLSNEREAVNSYLRELPVKHIPKNEFDNILAKYSEHVESEKVPPIEYLILEKTLKPVALKELDEIGVPVQLLNNALTALNIKGMIVIKGDKIEINWRKKDLFEKGLIKPYWPLNR
jgi:hypothetical protein